MATETETASAETSATPEIAQAVPETPKPAPAPKAPTQEPIKVDVTAFLPLVGKVFKKRGDEKHTFLVVHLLENGHGLAAPAFRVERINPSAAFFCECGRFVLEYQKV